MNDPLIGDRVDPDLQSRALVDDEGDIWVPRNGRWITLDEMYFAEEITLP